MVFRQEYGTFVTVKGGDAPAAAAFFKGKRAVSLSIGLRSREEKVHEFTRKEKVQES